MHIAVLERSEAGIELAEPEVESEEVTQHVPLYRVLLHDDDLTPMDFVTDILRRVFRKPQATASRIMYEAHGKGLALVEIVPFELAEMHVDQARSLSRTRHFPLTFSIEPEA